MLSKAAISRHDRGGPHKRSIIFGVVKCIEISIRKGQAGRVIALHKNGFQRAELVSVQRPSRAPLRPNSWLRRPRLRDYELERRRLECPLEECADGHPLQRIVAVSSLWVWPLSKG